MGCGFCLAYHGQFGLELFFRNNRIMDVVSIPMRILFFNSCVNIFRFLLPSDMANLQKKINKKTGFKNSLQPNLLFHGYQSRERCFLFKVELLVNRGLLAFM